MASTNPTQITSERLALLSRLSHDFNASPEIGEVLNRVMDEVISIMGAERGFVMLIDPDQNVPGSGEKGLEEGYRLIPHIARGIDQDTVNSKEFQGSRGVVQQVLQSRQPLLTSDAMTDTRFSYRESIMLLRIRSILCVPLKIQERLLGVIYIDNRIQAGIFSPEDLDLLSAIAANAAIAIENARLYQVAIEKARMERELQMAYRVQANLLPRIVPQFEGWEFASRWLPAREVAGDYYDFIPIQTPPDAPPKQGVVIADVTDKGMPAALFMTLTRSTLRASLYSAPSPSEGISHANALVSADSPNSMFVTLCYAQITPLTGEIVYVNAGHNPPLVYRRVKNQPPAQASLEPFQRTGIPLGIDGRARYEERQITLAPGDFIFFYTDGVIDALNRDQNDFGMERMLNVILDHTEQPANEIISALEAALQAFIDENDPYDDITMLVIKRTPAINNE